MAKIFDVLACPPFQVHNEIHQLSPQGPGKISFLANFLADHFSYFLGIPWVPPSSLYFDRLKVVLDDLDVAVAGL